jgi:PKD repeat protein
MLGSAGRAHPRLRRAMGIAALIALLAAPGIVLGTGGPSAPPAGGPSPSSAAAGVLVAPAFVPTASDRTLGPLPASTPMSVAVALESPDPAALAERIALEYAPGSPQYHHFLTPGELAAGYAPAQGVYARAVAYFEGQGLSVRTSPDRTLLFVSGGAGPLGRSFDTSFDGYATVGRTFFSHPTAARLPAGIPWASAVGLGNETPVEPSFTPPAGLASAGPVPSPTCGANATITPCLAARAYNASALFAAGDNGTGVRLGIVDTYDAGESENALQSDLGAFTRTFGLPVGNISYLYPVPTTSDLNTTYDIWGLEEALDLEWSRAMAPGASIDMTFAPNSEAGLYQAVDWLVAHDAVDVISMSWGENDVGVYNSYQSPVCTQGCNATSDGSYETLHPVLEAAAAEGISAFAATGDCGAADGTAGVATNYPASDPYVTAVGGTNLRFNATTGAWINETGWSGNAPGSSAPGCGNQGGSGGGFSPFPRPSWQSAPGLPTSPDRRAIPDVSALAGSPGAYIVRGGFEFPEGGTSLATPMWAGLTADADSLHRSALGFLDPSLYQIARSANASRAFHDVTVGWNGYYAGAGWDAVTGIGTPDAAVLLPLLAGTAVTPANASVALSATPRFGPTPLTVNFTANDSTPPSPVAFYDIDFGDQNSTSSTDGNASYTYPAAGVYAATATAFLEDGTSSGSQAVPIVVGGGGPLTVTLNATPAHPALGAPVTLWANATGGTGPYHYTFLFGDGTILNDSNSSNTTHAYRWAGGFCAQVIVADSASPPDGGAGPAVPIDVGSGSAPVCANSGPMSAQLTVARPALDRPGDFLFRTNQTGGRPPYSVRYTSDDPYASVCGCGIFSTTGNHTVTAWVSDSLSGDANATANVTVYPALVGHFQASVLAGSAPLSANFSVTLSGGHLANPASTFWQFGDGQNATGAAVQHVYANPGFYEVLALASDGFGGHASEAFLMDVYAPGAPPPTVISASVTPAVDVPRGTLVNYSGQAIGADGPYTLLWSLGDGESAYGSTVEQSYSYGDCRGPCPMNVSLTVSPASGPANRVYLALPGAELGNATRLHVALASGGGGGPSPYAYDGRASASGMPGVLLAWTFGDGTSATGPDGTHVFDLPGNYTVTLRATDPSGDDIVATQALEVTGVAHYPPIVTGGPSVREGFGPLNVSFSVSASGGAGGPYSYAWSFGDGTSGQGASVSHRYDQAGNFSANVTAADALGVTTTVPFAIAVYAPALVGLPIAGVPPSMVAGSSTIVSVSEGLDCDAHAAPNCSRVYAPLAFDLLPSSAARPTNLSASGSVVGAAPGGLERWLLVAPVRAGNYTLYVGTVGISFNGSNWTTLTVLPAPAGPRPSGMSLSEILDIAIPVATAATIALVLLVGRRRARARPPTP